MTSQLQDLKRDYMTALHDFERTPDRQTAEAVDGLYRQLRIAGVYPWLCTDHKPTSPLPKGSSVISATCNGEYIVYLFQKSNEKSVKTLTYHFDSTSYT